MRKSHGFVLMWEKEVEELKRVARLWKHERTGAQLLSCVNADENKVFGVSFRTPPKDSTGVAHILEHSVLCGSKKYPVKEPFVELLKGSLQTFLNAFTFPDKPVTRLPAPICRIFTILLTCIWTPYFIRTSPSAHCVRKGGISRPRA